MSNIIPFDGDNLPAYLKTADATDINNDLTAHAGGGFPVISIKGKIFTIVRDGERTVLPNPKDPDSAATSIEVVMLKVNKGTSKVWYAKGYQEGVENVKPDCFSNDGIRPDSQVDEPVSKSCATCPNNQWGSKISEQGSKGKACQDSVRMAVATPDRINDPYLIRIPPASIRALGELGKVLEKRGGKRLAYNMVLTKIGFVMEEATPKLTFKAVGLLDDESYKQVQEVVNSDVVAQILGSTFVSSDSDEPDLPAVSVKKTEDEVEAPKPKATPKPKAEPKAKAESKVEAKEEVEVTIPDLNLDDLNFDD
jgi:hypothetical protein